MVRDVQQSGRIQDEYHINVKVITKERVEVVFFFFLKSMQNKRAKARTSENKENRMHHCV